MTLIEPDAIISGTCNAAGVCTGGLWAWAGLAGAALMASVVLLTFIYLWASLFRNAQLNAYVKQEIYEMVATAVLVIFVLATVGVMSTLTVDSFFPKGFRPADLSPGTTIYNATAMYYKQVDDDMSGWLNMNYVMNMYVDQIASVTPYARPLGVGLVASPLAGLASPIKQLLYNMSVALSVAFIINHAQLIVYIFALQAFLKYYLPAGIFLRCFTPTRRLGGTLIGVSVAFLFVFPALTMITYSMFYNEDAGPLLTFRSMMAWYMSSGDDGGDSTFMQKFRSFFGSNVSSPGIGVTELMAGVIGGIGTLLEKVVGGLFLTLLMFPISTISWAFAIGFVIPLFNTIVFVQAAKILSKSFGEEVDISSLTRLI